MGKKDRIACKAVVVATGGYASNNFYRALFNPETEGWAVYGGSQSTGDGYTMLLPHGATIAGFSPVMSGPTVEVNTLQAPITCNPNIFTFFSKPRSFMIVNNDGKRHYDETVIALYVDNNKLSGTFSTRFSTRPRSTRRTLTSAPTGVEMASLKHLRTDASPATKRLRRWLPTSSSTRRRLQAPSRPTTPAPKPATTSSAAPPQASARCRPLLRGDHRARPGRPQRRGEHQD